MKNKLCAWGNTTKLGAGDHTWVTTYTDGTGEPDTHLGDYWYCWGVSHSAASILGKSDIGADFARQIATPNDPEENVGIKYLVDGLCHQMANRLLRFTYDKSTGKRIKVSNASGYQLSKAMYGEYGGSSFTTDGKKRLQQWKTMVMQYRNNKEN
ncbi:hypothetical protein JK628_10570 [Shewanella sp. KX20019]|uniref:hypothetical protein n=1 Tax=Shewanella sp. KX20019 TaxID=2803864 RepID=UPI0019282285|nr:hypothetical protein [Shewanella sp. KX20019]QQX82205.1 hypothetical protein JK628_10570 [Shewanella sp. KX20019]